MSESARIFWSSKSPLVVCAGVALLMALVAGIVAYFYPSATVALGAMVAMVLFQVTSIALVVASLTDDVRRHAGKKHGDRRAPT